MPSERIKRPAAQYCCKINISAEYGNWRSQCGNLTEADGKVMESLEKRGSEMEKQRWLERQRLVPIPLKGSWKTSFVLPSVKECGETVIDITGLEPRLLYGKEYRVRGIAAAPERCYVRLSVYKRLCRALRLLPEPYSIYIYDSFRPQQVQQALFEQVYEKLKGEHPHLQEAALLELLDDYVAKPQKSLTAPAPHATGGAVDLTLLYRGRPLEMGTGFDDFTERAGTDYFEYPAHCASACDKEARDNRRLLYHVMCQSGLVNYDGEWWHYSYGDRMWGRKSENTPIYNFCEFNTQGIPIPVAMLAH